MNQEVKQLWLQALRSGEYTQGYSALKTQAGYCCLGVLCDLYQKQNSDGKWEHYSSGEYSFVNEDGYHGAFLPGAVKNWAGLNQYSPEVNRISLVSLNDNEKKSFVEIADFIETNL